MLSVDFNPASGLLASCGTDKEIKVRLARASKLLSPSRDFDVSVYVRGVSLLCAHS